jgi:hypothetical protein
MESLKVSKFRLLVSLLAISIGVLVVEPFSNLDGAFAQSLEETARLQQAARLHQQAIELYRQGRYAEAEPFLKRSLEIREKALGKWSVSRLWSRSLLRS